MNWISFLAGFLSAYIFSIVIFYVILALFGPRDDVQSESGERE